MLEGAPRAHTQTHITRRYLQMDVSMVSFKTEDALKIQKNISSV